MEKKSWGGNRQNSGRKGTGKPKKEYRLYFHEAKTYKFGGEEKFKKHLYDYVENYGEELKFTPATKESYDGKELQESKLDEPLQYQQPKENYFGLTNNFQPIDIVSETKTNISNAGSAEEIKEYLLAVQSKLTAGKFSIIKSHAEKVREQKGFIYND